MTNKPDRQPNTGLCCPSCGSARHIVVDSRPRENIQHRRRKCRGCGGQFSTYEFSEADVPTANRDLRADLKFVAGLAARIAERANNALRDE